MRSTKSLASCGGSSVFAETAKATAKLTMAPTAPKALGVMPKNQFSFIVPRNEVFGINMMPLCWNT